jgi:hypothetical protein
MPSEGLVLRAARGDQPVASCAIDGEPISIGSWAGATLPLEDDLLPVHVVLDPDGPGQWRLVSLSAGSCRVNGKAVRRATVTVADRIAVGPYEVSFSGHVARAERSLPTADRVASGQASGALRATLRWRGAPLDARVLAPGEVLTVGRGRNVIFEVPQGKRERWAAAACLGGVWHVALDAPLRAWDAEADHPLLSAAARTDGPALPRGFRAGRLWAPLPETGHVQLDAGDLSIDLEPCTRYAAVHIERPPRWATEEGQSFIIALMVFICLLAMFRITPWGEAPETESVQHGALIAQYQRPAPTPVEHDHLATMQKESKTEQGAEKSRMDEGEAGRPDAAERQAHRAGPKTDAEIVRDQALLRALSSGTTAQLLAGGSLSAASALGHLAGPVAGDAKGMLGLGLHDSGPGGGGLSADTVGIGPLGTKGVGLGAASQAGKVGRAGPSDLSMEEPASVQGGLDREVIRRVILSHRAQIRYCYEKQLSSTPNLAGKVLVEFVISGEGAVTTARAAEQTLQDPAVAECIVSRVKTWTFPKPRGGGVVVVTYPFLFKPAGQGSN